MMRMATAVVRVLIHLHNPLLVKNIMPITEVVVVQEVVNLEM
jgi:hypothetical protein